MIPVETPVSNFPADFFSFVKRLTRDVLLSMGNPSIYGVLAFVIVLLFLLFLLLVCRPWRLLARTSTTRPSEINEITRPLFAENLDAQNDVLTRVADQTHVIQVDDGAPIRTHGFVNSVEQSLLQEDSYVDSSNDSHDVGNTLKRPLANWQAPDSKHLKKSSKDLNSQFPPKDTVLTRSTSLCLEVLSGASSGLKVSRKGKENSAVTIGRVPPSNLVLKDSEVSGKHAIIKWNTDTLRWEITDLGSLNGTFLNSDAVNHPDEGSRQRGFPFALSDGDVLTFGSTSKVSVKVSESFEEKVPAGIGMASDPMASRRGGKPLPMEDVGVYQYPLSGCNEFGLACVFDGHGGVGAAKFASKAMPVNVAKILSDGRKREKVLSNSDASDVLRQAFALTEDQMDDYQYEGCTATVMLIWSDWNGDFFAQCANLGDSFSVMYVNGTQILTSEDHKVISAVEKARMVKLGKPLRDGESRLCGLNLSRMLGDKFLKEQDSRFSSEPYISQPIRVPSESTSFALLASDGLWDVLSTRQAVQIVLDNKEKSKGQVENSAERIAKCVVSQAKMLRTKDNTTVVFVDFDTLRTDSY